MKAVLVIALICLAFYCKGEETSTGDLTASDEAEALRSEENVADDDTPDEAVRSEENVADYDTPTTATIKNDQDQNVPDVAKMEERVGEDAEDNEAPKVSSKSFSSSSFSSKIMKDGKVLLDKSGGMMMSNIDGKLNVKKFGDMARE